MTTPIDRRDKDDVGDQVIRKFRYQHAYGVILAIRMVTENGFGKAIWCEQHEDLLVEYGEDHFDAYQIKTRKSELGEWELNEESLLKSIARFLEFDKKFPGKIRKFYFVSNTQYSDSNAKKRKYLSPLKLLRSVDLASKYDELSGESLKGFNHVKGSIDADVGELFSVLKRLDLVLSLTERALEDELCQRHISILPQCQSASARELAKIRESLIALVTQAASLSSEAPTRDWIGLTKGHLQDPYLISKRITADHVNLAVADAHEGGVRFPPGLASINLKTVGQKSNVLLKKMTRGGLAGNYEMMHRRTILAEQELLDLATRLGSDIGKNAQIENIVFGECDDAYLRNSNNNHPFGSAMLIDAQDRLKLIAKQEPKKVCGVPYDVLVGVAGLLTSECKIWWSEKFKLEGEQ